MNKLIPLYQKMYEHTVNECSKNCRCPNSCCSPEYCMLAKQWAKDKWNIDLIETNHSKLPFMGPSGCTVPPHLRPMCTLHTCSINSLGFKPKDPEWTKKYFKLREKIENLESLENHDP